MYRGVQCQNFWRAWGSYSSHREKSFELFREAIRALKCARAYMLWEELCCDLGRPIKFRSFFILYHRFQKKSNFQSVPQILSK